MRYLYKTKNTCSSQIEFDLENGIISNIKFTNGCQGNLEAISRILDGAKAEDVILKCEGIKCGRRPTSCSDQLSIAIKEAQTKE